MTASRSNNQRIEGSISSVITIPVYRPLSLAAITVYRTDEGITISWEPTLQEQIITYKAYLYAVTCTNGKNIESRIDDWTGTR